MKLRDIAKGKRAVKKADFPIPDHGVVEVGLLVLPPDEEADVIRDAKAFAREKGNKDPKDNDPEYELGHMLHTLARTVIDYDAWTKSGAIELFASFEDLRKDERVGRDGIVYLYRQQKQHQLEVAPKYDADAMQPEQFVQMCLEIAGANKADPFWQRELVYQSSYIIFTAKALAASLVSQMPKSPSTSGSGSSGPSSKSASSSSGNTERSRPDGDASP